MRFRVAQPLRGTRYEHVVERILGVGAELDASRGGVLFKVLDVARSGDRHDKIAARQKPGKAKLCRGTVFRRGMGFQLLDKRQVTLQVVALEARHPTPRVALAQGVERRDRAGQKAPT